MTANRNSKSTYILVFIIILAITLRFYHIDYQSVWLDEICSITEANPAIKWSDLEATLLVSDPHPQLYFVFLKTMFLLFGNSTLIARILSAIIGVVGVYCFYLLSKEFANRKVAIISTLLLSVNYFHIYYSQEVRMYGLLFLFTVLSFYRLILFVKNKNLRNTTWYGISTGLMLLTQFFGLFVLASQLLILLFYFLKIERSQRSKYLQKSMIAGGIIVVLFLPALKIFIATTKKRYAAIEPTTIDTILQIFKDFAQDSYIIIILSIIAIGYYFLNFNKESLGKESKESLTVLILLTWIIVALTIPIVLSYLISPMISSRYFITILPAILILIAMGIDKVRHKKVKILAASIFVSYSLFHLIYSTEYYTKVNKTQFREVTNHVINNNFNADPVVSNLRWYLLYFFNNEKIQGAVIQSEFEDFVVNMSTGAIKSNSFWFLGAFGNPLELSKASENYLADNFTIVNNVDLYDCWTKHYISKNIKNKNTSIVSIKLSNLTDSNWDGGVHRRRNIFLAENTVVNQNLMNNADRLKFKDGRTVTIVEHKKVGNYVQIFIKQENAYSLKEVAAFPNSIEILYQNE